MHQLESITFVILKKYIISNSLTNFEEHLELKYFKYSTLKYFL